MDEMISSEELCVAAIANQSAYALTPRLAHS
jgi:hypothetical protein